jgi:hypothetical protein
LGGEPLGGNERGAAYGGDWRVGDVAGGLSVREDYFNQVTLLGFQLEREEDDYARGRRFGSVRFSWLPLFP